MPKLNQTPNPRKPDSEEVKFMAQELMERMHAEMAAKMDAITEDLSLKSNEVDKQVFTILDAYQTACVSFTAFCDDIRNATGKKTEKSIIGIGGIPVSTNGSIN